jgi:phage FluMu protein Com
MGLLGRLTGWDQTSEAHNAVVASHFLESATVGTKRRIVERLIEIQHSVKGRYAGSLDDILDDLNERPRSVQMNFVALACNSLGIQPDIRGLQFNDVRNPYFADDKSTLEKIDFTVRWINKRHPVNVAWPENSERVNFRDWLAEHTSKVAVRCPSCAQLVSVPSGKKLSINCPRCEQSWLEDTSATKPAAQRTVSRSGDAAGENDYEAAVHHVLRNEFQLDRSTQWRVKAYDELIQQSRSKGLSTVATALEVAVAYFVAQCLGDASDREDASYLLSTLQPRINLAGLSGEISDERATQLSAVVKEYLDQKVLKDIDEGTGLFSPDRLNPNAAKP